MAKRTAADETRARYPKAIIPAEELLDERLKATINSLQGIWIRRTICDAASRAKLLIHRQQRTAAVDPGGDQIHTLYQFAAPRSI